MKKRLGRPIRTGDSNQGHEMDFRYEGEGENQKCFMTCKCGWEIEIDSFRRPWSLIEIKVKNRKHLQDLGLE
jgi:hypothetical protein